MKGVELASSEEPYGHAQCCFGHVSQLFDEEARIDDRITSTAIVRNKIEDVEDYRSRTCITQVRPPKDAFELDAISWRGGKQSGKLRTVMSRQYGFYCKLERD
ncbi:hypothetical protein Tcan_13479 [Toxocara canis]|uniref:Uncharacterized protein n=1 Tax=Toxocara canis TaxID=6265 RepID=A0A0B2VPP7_TOXCA|nr:hypothetical protein Tcan_13479 [Toxocara canis]